METRLFARVIYRLSRKMTDEKLSFDCCDASRNGIGGTLVQALFHSFATKDYRWLWFITTLTNAGSWTYTLVVTWQAYELTHSSSWSGAIMFATLVPNIVGAPIAGVLADVMDRRRIMFFVAITQVLDTGLLAFLSHFGLTTPMWLLGLSFVFGFASSALSVMLSSLVPAIVSSDKLFNALSLQAVAQRGTEFVGPAVASPLLISFGPGMVYLLASCLYLFASALVFFLSPIEIHSQELNDRTKSIFSPLVDGFIYIRRTPTIGILVSLVGLHCALTMAYMGILPQFVKISLHGDGAFYGVMMSTIGLGSILGTLLLAGVRNLRIRGSLYWMTALISGISLFGLAISHRHLMAIPAIALVGASQAAFMTLSLGYIQQMAAKHMRGRVTSFYLVLAGGFMSLANLGYGALSSVIPPTEIMAATGSLFVLVVIVYGVLSKQFRSVSRTGVFMAQSEMPVSTTYSVS